MDEALTHAPLILPVPPAAVLRPGSHRSLDRLITLITDVLFSEAAAAADRSTMIDEDCGVRWRASPIICLRAAWSFMQHVHIIVWRTVSVRLPAVAAASRRRHRPRPVITGKQRTSPGWTHARSAHEATMHATSGGTQPE